MLFRTITRNKTLEQAILIALVSALALIMPALCRAEIFTPEPVWRSAVIQYTSGIVIGDVDGDGDLDLVCGNNGQGSALFMNEGGIFSATPIWSSQVQHTHSVALGDVDGDGDLDLVCGNYEEGTTLLLNEGESFSRIPAWTSPQLGTYGVALGDVDGDGDLDLVCGSHGWASTLFLNDGGIFSALPAWSSPDQSTTDVALGDIDGDGDLDLVCANYGQYWYDGGSTLFVNVGGVFSTIPAWSSPVQGTFSVVLGDVDGDGDLDLVCGNFGNSSLFLNEGGIFSATPAWLSPDQATSEVDLGDVDGDGDLDLLCGNSNYNGFSRLFLNEGGIFSATPTWSSPKQETSSIVLGDTDGDGDLDVVCGNYGSSSTLFLNERGAFSTTPAWSSSVQITDGVAMDDLDGDGDLDLVCGCSWGSSAYYLNEGGGFAPTPSGLIPERNTRSVALGDVDGDGDLDLVRGNLGQESELFINVEGVFSTTPAWLSPQQETFSVTLGDVDGDGDLDLVCGNNDYYDYIGYPKQKTTLFLNEGGIFSSDPAWSSPAQYTNGTALGDVDADGDLDLLCGNYGCSALFKNEGGIFSTTPAWLSPEQHTTGIALRDVDGDGRLDIICGNHEEGSALFLNQGGAFSTTPTWSSPVQETSSIALADMGGDGYLDLICGNYDDYYGQGSTLFMNVGGVFSMTPSWSSPTQETSSIALGDLDDDGDLDLICGNIHEGTRLYRALANPVYSGDPAAPTNHLSNNSAFLRSVRVSRIKRNVYRITAILFDVESDFVWILPEYHFEGAPTWHKAQVIAYSGNIGPLTTSPWGIEHEFDWDVSTVPFDSRRIALRLRAISNPKRVSIIQHVASYCKDIGFIDIRRSQITVSDTALSFKPITVGDTAFADLLISNSGNEPLHIFGLTLPSGEMRIGQNMPMDLEPDSSAAIRVFIEPKQDTLMVGDVLVESNDLLNPIKEIPIQTTVYSLRMRSRLLSVEPELPLGQAVTIVVAPDHREAHIEDGFVHYRSAGATSFQDSVLLAEYETNYIATIPGSAVTEAGLEYYIRLENNGVFATDPEGAPDSVFSRKVAVPQGITSAPQPNAGMDFLESRDIKIQVLLPDGAEFVAGMLRFREGGESLSSYRAVALQIGAPLPYATIPDSLVGPRGLEYWVEVQTLKVPRLTDPAREPEDHPYCIRVTVPDLIEEGAYPAREYRMITVPLDFGVDFTGTLEALLSDQAAFGPYDPVQWRSFRYVPTASEYVELPSDTTGEFIPRPGRAYWLISASENRIETAPVKGLSIPTDSAYALTLEPGWNMIGDPFVFPVAWDSIKVEGLQMEEAEGSLVEPPVAWDSSCGYCRKPEVLEPFEGYWVKNRQAVPIVLQIPPKEAGQGTMAGATAESSGALGARVAANLGWRLEIGASSCGVADQGNACGVTEGAAKIWDKHDRSKPPLAPGRALSLYFPHQSWEECGDVYGVDIRGSYEVLHGDVLKLVSPGKDLWGHIWRFDVAKNFSIEGVGDEVRLEIAGVESVPAEACIYLVDRELGRMIDVRRERSYTYHMGERRIVSEDAARFALIVGSEGFIDESREELPAPPNKTVLYQNYPNPFNPSTIIRYDLAKAGKVRLVVYDTRGALVRVLYEGRREVGRYEEVWDGRNERGRQAAAGIYFSRLEAVGGFSETRKMLIIR